MESRFSSRSLSSVILCPPRFLLTRERPPVTEGGVTQHYRKAARSSIFANGVVAIRVVPTLRSSLISRPFLTTGQDRSLRTAVRTTCGNRAPTSRGHDQLLVLLAHSPCKLRFSYRAGLCWLSHHSNPCRAGSIQPSPLQRTQSSPQKEFMTIEIIAV
jgi:hypothetical protein